MSEVLTAIQKLGRATGRRPLDLAAIARAASHVSDEDVQRLHRKLQDMDAVIRERDRRITELEAIIEHRDRRLDAANGIGDVADGNRGV